MRTKVLVVIQPDGFIEVYGDKETDVVIRVAPAVELTAESERLVEEFIETTLPRMYRDLYEPGRLRGSEMPLPITPDEIMQVKATRAVYEALDAYASESADTVQETSEGETWIL